MSKLRRGSWSLVISTTLLLATVACAGRAAANAASPQGAPKGHLLIVGGGPIPDAILDRFLALAGGKGPPGFDRFDEHDDARPAGLRDEAGELADRAAADDRHCVPRLQLCPPHGRVPRGERVAEEHGGVEGDPRRYGA